MITGGFGFIIDVQTGAARYWYLKDGIKCWSDTDELVDPLPLALPVSDKEADSK